MSFVYGLCATALCCLTVLLYALLRNRPVRPEVSAKDEQPQSRIRAWLHRWQEPLLWFPAMLAILLAAYYILPALDPRAGIDGWGTLWGQLSAALGVMLAAFFTWLLRRTYQLELGDADERELIDHAAGIVREADGTRIGAGPCTWQAFAVWAYDRAGGLVVFWLLLRVFVP